MRRFTVIVEDDAQRDLDEIGDRRVYAAIENKIDRLEADPDKQGKPLRKDLTTYRSIRAAQGRYRVIYQVAMVEGLVMVVVVGIRAKGDRRDVYRRANRRLLE